MRSSPNPISPAGPAALTPRLLLVAGDLVGLFLFAFLGRESHQLSGAALALLLLVVEFWGAWLAVGWLAGAFAPPGRLGDFMRRSLAAWLAAAPLAVLLRALALGRGDIPVTFLLVTLGVGGALVLGWRLVFALFVLRRAS